MEDTKKIKRGRKRGGKQGERRNRREEDEIEGNRDGLKIKEMKIRRTEERQTPKNRQSEGIKTRAEIKEGGRDNGGKQRGISDGEQNKKEQQEEERQREGSE